jgi:hypothetical protein
MDRAHPLELPRAEEFLMLALAEILALILLNALSQAGFARWKLGRRVSHPRRPAKAPVAIHYPLHPSPAAPAISFYAAPEHAAHIRPAGIDW